MTSLFVMPRTDIGSGIKPPDGAKLEFFELDGVTKKDTYTTKAATVANSNPVIANAVGLFQAIYITGDYLVTLTDKDDLQIFGLEPIFEFATVTDNAFVRNIDTLAAAIASNDITDGDTLRIKERETGKGGGGDWSVVLASTVTTNTYNIVLNTGLASPPLALVLDVGTFLDVRQLGIFPGGGDNTSAWLFMVDTLQPKKIYMPKGTYSQQLFKVKADSEIFGDGFNETIIELFHTGSQSVVMGQINNNTTVRDLQLKSLETDLAQQRCGIESAENVTVERCKFVGFRDVTGSPDAWGLYIKDSKRIKIIQCGFDDNSQSDLALVDDNFDIEISGCFAINSTFHLNVEPNTSSDLNERVTIRGMSISLLALLENGSGGTSNKNITVEDCEIDVLKYDGAEVTFIDCQINGFLNGGEPFGGKARFVNTLGLGPNLLEDPYLINIALNQSSALTNNNSWYMRSRTGSIGSDQLDTVTDSQLRATRINPTSTDGIIEFAPAVNPVATITLGEVYCFVVTGKQIAGTAARFLNFFMSNEGEIECRMFRQSNVGSNYSTEMIFFPVTATGVGEIKFGPSQANANETLDVVSVSLHKVDINGRNAQSVIDGIHNNVGSRRIQSSGPVVVADTNLLAFQDGDIIEDGAITYVWDGTATKTFTVV